MEPHIREKRLALRRLQESLFEMANRSSSIVPKMTGHGTYAAYPSLKMGGSSVLMQPLMSSEATIEDPPKVDYVWLEARIASWLVEQENKAFYSSVTNTLPESEPLSVYKLEKLMKGLTVTARAAAPPPKPWVLRPLVLHDSVINWDIIS